MKKLIQTLLFVTLFSFLYGQNKKIPSVELKDINGKTFNTSDIDTNGLTIISFWATWCGPCKRELNTMHDLYLDWRENKNVTFIAVSIDDQKTVRSVPMYVNAKGWEYLVLLDTNGDFKRLMGVNNIPHTFLIDQKGDIVYSHNNYTYGDEIIFDEMIKKLTKK